MVLDGSLGYIGRAEEPTRILFKGGRITEIEETPTGIQLKKYMEDYQDPRIYIAGELGIGLNSCSQCLGNCYIEDESAYGTFHVGLGRNIALGGIQNAKGHFVWYVWNRISTRTTDRLCSRGRLLSRSLCYTKRYKGEN